MLHASYDPKKFMEAFLSKHYKGHSVQIVHGCCRKCLKHGQPIIYDLSKDPWGKLLTEGLIDPYQTAAVFYPGSQFHAAHFKKPVLNLTTPAMPCRYPAMCELTCLLCNKYIDGPGSELPDWPGFKVHAQCTIKCQAVGCSARLPDFPAYINYQRARFHCEEHVLARSLQGMSLNPAVSPKMLVSPKILRMRGEPAGDVKADGGYVKADGGINNPAKPTPIRFPVDEKMAKDKKKTPVKKTVTFKDNPKRGQSSIAAFFGAPSKPEAPKEEPIIQTDQPRRFIRNKQGTIYAYWKGDCAHCIDTDALLFTASGRRQRASLCVKLDFKPPERFTPPL
jgi:hypothetical protein